MNAGIQAREHQFYPISHKREILTLRVERKTSLDEPVYGMMIYKLGEIPDDHHPETLSDSTIMPYIPQWYGFESYGMQIYGCTNSLLIRCIRECCS